MDKIIRVELPLRSPSKILNQFRTIGEMAIAFPAIKFLKYIFVDPVDNLLKGANPLDNMPVVVNAYITVSGDIDEVIKFTKVATSE